MVENTIVMYKTPDGKTAVEVKLEDETVWLSQAQMVELFQTSKQNISLHINNLFAEGELEVASTVKEYLTVQIEGKRTVSRETKYYNLDVIISVGYRVKSQRGTQFRIWANSVLKEYLIKGYAVQDNLQEEKYDELKKLVYMLGRTLRAQNFLNGDQSDSLLDVVIDYTYALDTLDKYD